MTPRQKKRLARASAKGRPLQFIKFRAATKNFSASIGAAFMEMIEGQRCAAYAIRDHIRRTFSDMVLRPLVRSIVRDVVKVVQ